MDKQVKKKKFLVQGLCLLLSFGLWVYINASANPVGQKTIKNVPVQILNTDILAKNGLALVPNEKLTVNVNITGQNESIYNSTANDYKVELLLANNQLTVGNNWVTAQVVSSPPGVSVTSQFIKVNLKLEAFIKKQMTVQSNIDVQTNQGVYVKNITLSPEVVTIEGAQSAVDSVDKVVAEGSIQNVNRNSSITANLVALNSNGQKLTDVDIYPATVTANINTENGKLVPINVVTTGTAQNGINIKSITPDVKNIEVVGSNEALAKISAINTVAINLSQVSENNTVTANLELPSGITVPSGKNSVMVSIQIANENNQENSNNNENSQNNNNNNSNNNNNNNNHNNNNNNQNSNEVEKTLTVPITITGEKSGYKYELSTTSAQVVLKGNSSSINSINLAGLISPIDVSNIDSKSTVKLNVNAGNGISVVSVNPEQITITANKTNG